MATNCWVFVTKDEVDSFLGFPSRRREVAGERTRSVLQAEGEEGMRPEEGMHSSQRDNANSGACEQRNAMQSKAKQRYGTQRNGGKRSGAGSELTQS